MIRFVSPLLILIASLAPASDMDEFNVKRQETFEFTAKPSVTRVGDNVTISFASKAYCDATICIVDPQGRIVRHLVSGVLGPNAPEPFAKNSLEQAVIWDGKNDKGEYVDEKESLTVRVSLGLRPQFERSLFHSPYKRFGRNQPLVSATPEGVYVYEGDIVDSVRLFDHEGTYVRTVYPFPQAKLEQVKGLRWHAAPQDGARLPLKEGYHQATFFTSGYNAGYDPATGYGLNRFLTLKHFDGSPNYPAASAFAVRGERIALAGVFLNRMATDGSSGGMELSGPKTSFAALNSHYCAGQTPIEAFPRAAALSSDGKCVYLTGYTWDEGGSTAGNAERWIHGVAKVSLDGEGKTEMFVGSPRWGGGDAGSGPDRLNSPMSVACDSQGRVYVADYANNRIQVFTPDGKVKESIPSMRPTHVAVHQRTGEIYVFSWGVLCDALDGKDEKVEAVFRRLEGLGNHRQIAECRLPLPNYGPIVRRSYGPSPGLRYRVELDSWTDPPTLWLVSGSSIRIFTVAKDGLTLKRDLDADARKATACDVPSGGSRQRLAVNPQTGKLYILDGMGLATGDRVVEIEPKTGRDRYVDLPFGAEDVCFDIDGLAYLRTGETVVRYDAGNWREIPWDYGEERRGVSHCGGRAADVVSGLMLPGTRASPWYHGGGFGISPRGHLVVQCWNGAEFAPKRDRTDAAPVARVAERYTPTMYAGRQRWGEIHVWDRHGKVLYEDATPGVTITDGIAIDKDDCVYVMANPTRTPDGQRKLNPKTETLMKFRPGKGRVVTSGAGLPVPLKAGQEPAGPTQTAGFYQGPSWVQGAEWLYGEVGYAGGRCTCWNARFALDYYARSFAPEPDHFSVAVLDTNGNVILRVGRPGNVEDGKPLVPDPVVRGVRSIGGDEVSIMHSCYVAVDTDRRLFIADAGNRRIVSVRLGYHATESIALKDVPDRRD